MVVADRRESIPVLIEHMDRYPFDGAWRAIWTMGKLQDECARPKLEELSQHENQTLAAMAQWSLDQLPQHR